MPKVHLDQVPPESEIHHRYFEDNDGFFPPTWLGKDLAAPNPSPESDSTTTFQGAGMDTGKDSIKDREDRD